MSSLQQVFTGDSKQLEKAYQSIQRENIKLREELKNTADAHKQAGEEAESAWGGAKEAIGEQLQELTKMVAGLATVEKGLEAVNEEYERQIELAEKAAEAVNETGSSRPHVIRNLGPITAEQRREFFEQSEGIQLRRGLKEAEINQALDYALSATGGNRERALKLTELASQAAPEGGGDTVGNIARSIEQVSTVTKRDDDHANLGLLFSAQKVSPIKEIENIASYAVPAAMSMTAQGATPEESFGLFASLAKGMGDVEGRRTRTAAINLQGGLQKFFDPEAQRTRVEDAIAHQSSLKVGERPDEELLGRARDFLGEHGMHLPTQQRAAGEMLHKLFQDRPELGQQFVDRETARLAHPTSITEQIRTLQQDEQLRTQFNKSYTPEAQAKGADIELLRAGSQVAMQFEAATKELQQINFAEAAKRQIETIQSDPAVQRLLQARIMAVMEEQLRNDFNLADRGNALKGIEQVLGAANIGWGSSMGNWWRQKSAEGAMLSGEDPFKVFQRIAAEMRYNQEHELPTGRWQGFGFNRGPVDLFPENAPRTSDIERQRKGRVIGEGGERVQEIRAAEEAPGEAEGAIHEETPAKQIERTKPAANESAGYRPRHVTLPASVPGMTPAGVLAQMADRETLFRQARREREAGDRRWVETLRLANQAGATGASEGAEAYPEAPPATPPIAAVVPKDWDAEMATVKSRESAFSPLTRSGEELWGKLPEFPDVFSGGPDAPKPEPELHTPDVSRLGMAMLAGEGERHLEDSPLGFSSRSRYSRAILENRNREGHELHARRERALEAGKKYSTVDDWMGHHEELRDLIQAHRDASFDLTHKGKFNAYGQFDETIPDRAPTQQDRTDAGKLDASAAALEKMLAVLERIERGQDKAVAQSAQQHRESESRSRQQMARAQGQRTVGRES